MGVEELAHCRQSQIDANASPVPFKSGGPLICETPTSGASSVDGISSPVAAELDHHFQPKNLLSSASTVSSTDTCSTVSSAGSATLPPPSQSECRRRTSLPLQLSESDSKQLLGVLEERRWRSFDCASVGSSSCASSSSKSQSLKVLESRIHETQQQFVRSQQRLSRKLLLKKVGAWFSWRKKEQVRLRQMALIAEVAKRNRSLYILEDLKTLVLTMEDDDLDLPDQQDLESPDHQPERLSGESDEATGVATESDLERRLFWQGVENSDRVLQEDVLHHLLEMQTKWLHRMIQLRETHGKRRHLTALWRKSHDLNEFLSQFASRKDQIPTPNQTSPSNQNQSQSCPLGGTGGAPWSFEDEPTPELLRFERLIGKNKFLKPSLRNALDQLSQDVLTQVTGNSPAVTLSTSSLHRFSDIDSTRIFQEREPRDVLRSLVREVADSIAVEAQVQPSLHGVLRSFVEQMLFSRLACAAFLHHSTEIDELNALWREQVAKLQSVSVQDMGLPAELGQRLLEGSHENQCFSKSIAAFNRLPHLVPSSILSAFLSAIRVMYKEAHELLGVTCGQMSADVILPLLVFILSRSELSHLHSQVALIESFAIDSSTEGSEAAYYLACLQAAMAYIMTRDE